MGPGRAAAFVCGAFLMLSGVQAGHASGAFQKEACGAIDDSRSGLEWFVGPDANTSWNDAVAWVQRLQACGGGWTMPTLAQLTQLFNPGVSAGTGYAIGGRHWPAHIDPIFSVIGGGSWVWAGSFSNGATAPAINFNQGVGVEMPVVPRYPVRVFAVRRMRGGTSPAGTGAVPPTQMTQNQSAATGAAASLGGSNGQSSTQLAQPSATSQEMLTHAAMLEDPQTYNQIMAGRAINAPYANGMTALGIAAERHHVSMATWLLRRGANPNIRNNLGATPLDIAAGLGDTELARAMLAKGGRFAPDDGSPEWSESTRALFAAVAADDIKAVTAALNAGANVQARDSMGETPLHFASALMGIEISKLLLIRGAQVDARNHAGSTPLMNASFHNAELLLARDANPNAIDKFRFSALGFAAYRGNLRTVELLLAHGASVNLGAATKPISFFVQHSADIHSPEIRQQILDTLSAAESGHGLGVAGLSDAQAQRERQLKAEIDDGMAALRAKRLQELTVRFGPFARAVMAKTAETGMGTDAVRAALGPPASQIAIPPNYTVWVYPSSRIAFTGDKVSHIGH